MKNTLLITLSIMLLIFIQPGLALANSAPVYMPAHPNGTIVPIENVPVLVKEEKLQFVLRNDYSPAQTTVQYVFQNTSSQNIEPFLAFPFMTSIHGENPRIFINNHEIPAKDIQLQDDSPQLKQLLDDLHSASLTDIDPVTGKPLVHTGEYEQLEQSAAIFKVSFPAGKEVVVRLEYDQYPGRDSAPYIHPIFSYQYLLQPAAKWKEFHHLQISIAVPKDHFFAANLRLEKYNGNFSNWLPLPDAVSRDKNQWQYYQGTFDSLPKDNLAFSKMSKEDLLFGMVEKDSYDVLGLLFLWVLTTAVIFLMTILITRFKKWWMNWLVGPVLSFIIACLATFGAYAIYLTVVPVAVYGELIGGYGVIFTFFLFVLYNAFIYFPIISVTLWLKKLLLKKSMGKLNHQ